MELIYDAFATVQSLMTAKRYHHALFFCHLTIEKGLKAVFVKKTGKVVPPIHNLLLLAAQAGITLSSSQREQLLEINTFNIEARYDDYKRQFYKKATAEFTKEWITHTQNIHLWLKTL